MGVERVRDLVHQEEQARHVEFGFWISEMFETEEIVFELLHVVAVGNWITDLQYRN